MIEHINKVNYKLLDLDPTNIIINKLHKEAKPILKKSNFNQNLVTYAFINNDRIPILYGLPKIHKDGAPIRPIISASKSLTDNLSWILDRILHPLLCLIPALVNNSVNFISKPKTLNLDWKSDNIMFIAADIESLYTNVPILEAIDSIIDLCMQFNIETYGISIEDFRKLLSLALCDNYFKYNDKYYAQGDCLAMGNRLFVIAANCFVYSF